MSTPENTPYPASFNASPTLAEDRASALRVSIYAVISLAAVLFIVCLGDIPISVLVSLALAVAAAATVHRANRHRPWAQGITVFFALAAAHAVYGYWAAGNSTAAIWIGSDAAREFRRSFLVISTTLLVAALTYHVTVGLTSTTLDRFAKHLNVSDRRLIGWGRAGVVLGALGVLYVVVAAGFMPLTAANPGAARYISDDLGAASERYSWVLHQGLDLLMCATPLVLFSALSFKKKADWVVAMAGVAAVVVSMERGYIISMLVILMLTLAYFQRHFPRKYLVFLVLLAGLYYVTQLVFLNAIGEDSNEDAAKVALLSGLPEVRDLGWTMSLAGDRRYWGATFLAPMIVGPGVATDFKTHYALAYVTLRLMGAEGDSNGGGLRITLAGEGYLNFGALGCLIVGSAFGVLCAGLAQISRPLLAKRDLASCYLVAVLFAWLCFWLYLGGTANAGPIRNGLIAVAAMFFLSRVRVRRRLPPLARTAPSPQAI